MHLNKSNLTSTAVYRAARQPQMLNYHIIVQPEDTDTLFEI